MIRKSALLIGCNYFGSALAMDGCIDTIHLFDKFLMERMYILDTMILCDMGEGVKPTKQNILSYFENMIQASNPGDILYFIYAGATQKLSKEALIVPCDYIQNGYISNNEFRDLLDMVPVGVTLICMMDTTYAASPISLRYEVTDISTGELSLKKEISNRKKIPEFKNYNSKQTVIENIPFHETDAAILFFFGLSEEQKNGHILWAFMTIMETMHLHGIQLNHLLTRMQALLRFNDIDSVLKLYFGQFLNLNTTFGRFVAGNI